MLRLVKTLVGLLLTLSIVSAQQEISYIYDDLGRLVAVIDPAQGMAVYHYDSVGNLLQIDRLSASQTAVIEFNPKSGPPGTVVTIQGTGFSAIASQNLVGFNGSLATVDSAEGTEIVATVPVGATTGLIQVEAPSGIAQSTESFTVANSSGGPDAPSIVAIAPAVGELNTTVTLTGSNFHPSPGDNQVTFGQAGTWADTQSTGMLTAKVPKGATSGPLTLTTPSGTATSDADFFVAPSPFSAGDVEVTDRMNLGESRTYSLSAGIRVGLILFDGTSGQQVTLSMSAVTMPAGVVSIIAPDASVLASASFDGSGGALGPLTLTAEGTYTICVHQERLITTVAGTGVAGFSGDGGQAIDAEFDTPNDVIVDNQGNLYVSDVFNQRIRKIGTDGVISTIAGKGQAGFGGDGRPAIRARLNSPSALAVDGGGNVFIADRQNHRIRKVDSNGIITTVAGNGDTGFSGDGGPATEASLTFPTGVAVTASGELLIADRNNYRIRRVDQSGIITTVAGSGATLNSGDGGAAIFAGFHFPVQVTADAQGNFYIATPGIPDDGTQHRVRVVDNNGVVDTLAGIGTIGYSGDGGSANLARIARPVGMAVDDQGNLYFGSIINDTVRLVSSGGGITTVAGTGTAGFGGDGGPATQAQLWSPNGVVHDGQGNLFIADSGNHRIRKLTPGLGGSVTLTLATQ